jgi:hypothetical protein
VVSIDTCAPAIEQMQAQSASDDQYHQQQKRSAKKTSGRGRGKRKGGGRSAAVNSATTSGDDAAVAEGIPLTIAGAVRRRPSTIRPAADITAPLPGT